jgi:hypothetical protein
MSIYRYNFNEIRNHDLKKYLKSKLNFEKWEDSIAEDATLSHFSNFNKISYGYPTSKNNEKSIEKIFTRI